MRKELELELQNRFEWLRRPEIDATKKKNAETVQEYSTYDEFGTEIPNGWYQLVVDMFSEIEELYNKEGIKPDYKLSQIKSKFGTLRVYGGRPGNELSIHAIDFIGEGSLRLYPEETDSLTKGINEVIKKYEKLSKNTCEHCGIQSDDVMLRTELPVFRWVTTLCTPCMNERIAYFNKRMKEQ